MNNFTWAQRVRQVNFFNTFLYFVIQIFIQIQNDAIANNNPILQYWGDWPRALL